jgi:hypothetical protein
MSLHHNVILESFAWKMYAILPKANATLHEPALPLSIAAIHWFARVGQSPKESRVGKLAMYRPAVPQFEWTPPDMLGLG